jgi:hypothetical protein
MFTMFGPWGGKGDWKENCVVEEQKCVRKYKITRGKD